jgi:hypothetical protein
VYDFHNRILSCGWGSMDPVGEGYPPATLHNDYPTGYESFYFMKYPLRQGEYAAFLNSLPPDVAALRAFVSGDGRGPRWTDSGYTIEKKEISVGVGYRPRVEEEWGGHTISSTRTMAGDEIPNVRIAPDAGGSEGLDTDPDAAKDSTVDALLNDVMVDKKEKEKEKNKAQAIPVYTARVPERPCGFIGWVDGFAYAVWAGLRPLTELEYGKLEYSPTRWGVRGSGGIPITVGTSMGRSFRGTHGDGTTPAGKPGAPVARIGPDFDHESGFDTAPADWPKGVAGARDGIGGRAYIGTESVRFADWRWGGGRSAATGHRAPRKAPAQSAPAVAKPDVPRRGKDVSAEVAAEKDDAETGDTVKVTNLKWEAGTKEYSFVTFDLAWSNSWRAAWMEPADKNVTGKSLKIESWDAAWVFVKIRKPGEAMVGHATLSDDSNDHRVPAGAALEVGLSDDGDKGLGVFIYRDAAGNGPVAFKSVRLRWSHGADGADPGLRRRRPVRAVRSAGPGPRGRGRRAG